MCTEAAFVVICKTAIENLSAVPHTFVLSISPLVSFSFQIFHCFSTCLYRHMHAQSGLTLCDPMDSSPLGSSILGFFRQEYWSGLSFLLHEIFLTQGLNPCLCLLHILHWQMDSSLLAPPGKPTYLYNKFNYYWNFFRLFQWTILFTLYIFHKDTNEQFYAFTSQIILPMWWYSMASYVKVTSTQL